MSTPLTRRRFIAIAATLAAGWVLFGQRLNNKGWIGLILLLAGMVMIKLA